MLSLAQRVQPRRAAGVRCARPQGPRPAGGPGARPGPALRRRAQDRWPRDHPALRARPVRPGRDPRRRHDRRGRDREPADDRGDPGALPEPVAIDVRGEVFMPKAEFARINEEREEAGLPLYANPRNSGAGSLRQKDPAVTAARLLSAWSYQLSRTRRRSTRSPARSRRLEALGFPVNPDREAGPRHRGRHRLHRALARGPPRPAVRDRRRRRQGGPVRPAGRASAWSAGRRAGRSPTSSRRSRSSRSSRTSSRTSAGPGR